MNADTRAFGAAPYLRSRITTGDLMYVVVLALLPCAGVGIYLYGFHAAILLGISVLSAILSELVCDLRKRVSSSVMDYSCIVTGLIGGLILPPSAPYWVAVLLPVLAIVVFKHLSGGLGRNLFNPAMAAKCVLLIVLRSTMLDLSTWEYQDGSPLVMLSEGETPSLLSMLTGRTAGYIGTSSAIAVLCAALILFASGLISLDIPLSALISFSVCYVLIGRYGLSAYTLGIQICGGSFLFTIFIMAGDFTTTPVSRKARVLYGILLGVLTFIFRRLGFLEDGVVYALLVVNLLRPLLDRWLPQEYFGMSSAKWVIRQTSPARSRPDDQQKEEKTNAQLDAEFAAFEHKIERETRGLETARYTGDDTLLREAMAEDPEGNNTGYSRNSTTLNHGASENRSGRTDSVKINHQKSFPGNMSRHERQVKQERNRRREQKSQRDMSVEEARDLIRDLMKKEQYHDPDELSGLQFTDLTYQRSDPFNNSDDKKTDHEKEEKPEGHPENRG